MMGYGMGFGGFGGWGGPAGLLWSVGCLLLIAGIVIAAVWLVARLAERPAERPQSVASSPDALETLRMRYARGEITEAEFSQAKSVLGYER